MIKRLCSLAAIAAVGAAFVAGCGSSSSSSSSSSTAPAASSGSSTAAPASSSTTAPGSVSVPTNLAQAVALCKSSIAAAPTLSADVKTKLQSLCDQAAQGNGANLRKIQSQVCQEIIKASVPASAQAQALATCPKP
jgi:hypothetical protein